MYGQGKGRFNNFDWGWGSGYFLEGSEIVHKNSGVGSQILYNNSTGVTDFTRHSTPSNLYKSA